MSEAALTHDRAATTRRYQLFRGAPVRYAIGVASLASVYYASAKLGYLLEFAGPVAAILWLPVGFGIAFLYLGGLRYWPGVLIGDLLANDYTALPLGSAIGQTCGNVLEVLLATMLIRRLVRRGSPLDTVTGVGWIVVAIAAGTALSASVGSLSLLLGDVIAWDALPTVWRTWWLGDFSGALIIVPLAIAWYRPRVWRLQRAHVLEGILMLATVVAFAEFATRSHRPLTYVVFPALTWAALRFGQRGATLAVAITALFTVWNTIHYVGPFHFQSVSRSVLSAQLFIAVAALTTLSLAAVVSEREQFAVRLGASRLRLLAAADNARRRLEQDLHDGAQLRLTWLAVHFRDAAELARREPDRAAALLQEAEGELELAIDELRELAHGIHPAVLVDLGLGEAVKSLALRSSIPVKLLELPAARLDERAETIGYYVVAEALANAQKHSAASSVRVRIAEGSGTLRIEVHDDGVGGAVVRDGSGLEGLRDRAEAIEGTMELRSRAGHGTRLTVSIPASTDPSR
jgi:signal transduction histidine kinase